MSTPQAPPRPRTAILGLPVRDIGPVTIGVLAGAYAALWLLARPAKEPWARHLGQLFGGESVLLFSVALVMMNSLRRSSPQGLLEILWIEIDFGSNEAGEKFTEQRLLQENLTIRGCGVKLGLV